MADSAPNMVALVEILAKAIVEAPDEVTVEPFEENGQTVLELIVAEERPGPRDRPSRTHGAQPANHCAFGRLRTRKRYQLEIVE